MHSPDEIPEHVHRFLDEAATAHADLLAALDEPGITVEDLESRFGLERLDLNELRVKYG
jgi:hypothetical protein